MKQAAAPRPASKTDSSPRTEPSAGPRGLVLAPPDYGIDFVDQLSAGDGPIQLNSCPRVLRQKTLLDGISNSPRVMQHTVDQIANSPRVPQHKAFFDSVRNSPQVAAPVPEPNNTGLPDGLKSGVESLSGLSLDNVKVHYNSSRPAQLNALAYARGSDIHLAPGQETHLPHEAWHVVQQAQGRVQPTMQMTDRVPVNDEAGLEHEADVMGARALASAAHDRPQAVAQRELADAVNRSSGLIARDVVQGVFDANTFKTLIEEQKEQQKHPGSYFEEGFTTVGFEHEFAQLTDGPLKGLTHVEVAHSKATLPFTELGFSLETDADNAVELVSPPFLVEIIAKDKPVPNPDHVKRMDEMMQARLAGLVKTDTTLEKLASAFGVDPGIEFELIDAKVTSSNTNPQAELPEGEREARSTVTIPRKDLKDSTVKHSRKDGLVVGISSQVNFATDASVYDTIKTLRAEDKKSNFDTVYLGVQEQIGGLFQGKRSKHTSDLKVTGNLDVFLREAARTLSGHIGLRSLHEAERIKGVLFAGTQTSKQEANKLTKDKSTAKQIYEFHTGMRSHVKDVQGVWLKDTLANFGLGLLTPDEWKAVRRILMDEDVSNGINALKLKLPEKGFSKEEKDELSENLKAAKTTIAEAMRVLAKDIVGGDWQNYKKGGSTKTIVHGPESRLPFGEHDPRWLGLRQDTYIPHDKVKPPSTWEGGRLHVVEGRGNAMTTLYELQIASIIKGTDRSDKSIADQFQQQEISKERVAEIRKLIRV